MKIGAMNHPVKPVYEEVISFGKARFDFVDLTLEGPNAYIINPDKMRPILDHYRLTVTGHTDPCLPWAYPIREVRKACFRELERCAEIFSALDAKIMNIHPSYFCPPAMRPLLVELNVEALRPIVDMAASYELTLVLENFRAPFDRVSTFKTIFQEVTGLGLHLDFGHTNFGKDDHEIFCKQLGHHIEHVHFSDNRGSADDHMPLGVGTINWQNAVDALKNTGYDEAITLEVFCNDPAMHFKYLDLSRELVQDLWNEKGH
jgi:sugar phosphate isomerase/epimerase